MIAVAPAMALAAPSGEPAGSGVPVPTAGLVNAALTARMSAQSTSLRDAVSRHSELIKGLVYNRDRGQDAPTQRQAYELSLLDAVEMALRNNLNVQVARYGPESSFHGINSARGAFDATMTFNLPSTFSRGSSPTSNQIAGGDIITQQNLSGGFSWAENLEWGTNYSLSYTSSRNSTNNELQTFNPTLTAGFRGNLTQPLLRNRGDVNRTGIRVAMNSYDSSLEGFRSSVQGILFQTINAYWTLRSATESLRIAEEALDLAQRQLRRNEIQVEIGTLAPIETVQAQTTVAGNEVSLIQAQNRVENAQDALKELLNFAAVVDDPFVYELVPTEEPEQTIAPI
ncbi:MAG: TolC family protein, partial [Acidobacteria bacterium]|nr:TolC family protein [Acidobacteriota bacterium]